MRRAAPYSLVPAVALVLLGSSAVCAQHLDASARGPVPAGYFNLNIHGVWDTSGWPTAPFTSWRSFQFYWRDLEPQQGVWKFDTPDYNFRQAMSHGVELLPVLQTIPQWAASNSDPEYSAATFNFHYLTVPRSYSLWSDYVRTLATRYKGKIHAYELWNEPDTQPSFDSHPELLASLNQAAYQTLKAVDPGIKVVSSALSSGDPDPTRPGRQFQKFLSRGGLKFSDVLAYHFYAAPSKPGAKAVAPEALLPFIDQIKAALSAAGQMKPIWSTETGWYILNDDVNKPGGPQWIGAPITPDQGAAFLARSYILGWADGLDRLYWYAWRDGYFGITELHGAPKAPETALAVVEQWLTGSTLKTCDRQASGLWVCNLNTPDGRTSVITWSDGEPLTLIVPPKWNVNALRRLTGEQESLPPAIVVNESPVLLFRS